MYNKHTTNIIYSFIPGTISIFITLYSIPIYLNYFDNDTYANFLIQHLILSLGMVLSLQIGKITSIKVQRMNKIEQNDLVFTAITLSILFAIFLSGICLFLFKLFLESKNFVTINVPLFIGLTLTIIYINLEFIARAFNLFKETSISNLSFYSFSISLPAFFVFFNIDKNLLETNLFNISIIFKIISISYLFILLIKKNILKITKINFNLTKNFFFHSKWMTITASYNQIYDYLDKHLIKIFFGSSSLIIYSIPQQIASKLTIISSAIVSVILPKLSATKIKKKSKSILSANLYLFAYVCGTIILILLPFFENILNWWLKEGFRIEMFKLFELFLLLTFLGSCSSILVSMYESSSIEKKNTILETYSILPFLIGLIIGIYLKSIYFFVFILILKEFILLNLRILKLKKFIFRYKTLMGQILLYSLALFLFYLENYYFYFINVFVLLIITAIKFPFKLLKNEFSKK